eukprot:2327851-Pyramimonas_sp.AAC.1
MEAGAAVRQLKRGKPLGPDDAPAVHGKSVSQTPGGLQWTAELRDAAWRGQKRQKRGGIQGPVRFTRTGG